MKKDMAEKSVFFDKTLKIEIVRFKGFCKPFPRHFHDYYVIGAVEKGKRTLISNGKTYDIAQGDVVLFNPGDSHECTQKENTDFDYIGLNIGKEVMEACIREMYPDKCLHGFPECMIRNEDIFLAVKSFYLSVLLKENIHDREEKLLLLLSFLIMHGKHGSNCNPCNLQDKIEQACEFIRNNYMKEICLDDICSCVRLSKSTLLRYFVRIKNVTPHCYLQNIRIINAKKLLEKGVSPLEASLQTGFSDQSHFTHCFNRFLGLTPALYQNMFKNKEVL